MCATQQAPRSRPAVALTIDHDRAVIVRAQIDANDVVNVRDRLANEPEHAFRARIVDDVIDDLVIVSGPADVQTAFDRAYVGVTHRPDRLIDAKPQDRRTD